MAALFRTATTSSCSGPGPDAMRAAPRRCRWSLRAAGGRLAAELELPAVATHPVQFVRPDDFRAHEARVCIAEGYVLSDQRRPQHFSREQYFKTQAEMAALFEDLPQALANSVEIAKRCNLDARARQEPAAAVSDAERRRSRRISPRTRARRTRAAARAALSRPAARERSGRATARGSSSSSPRSSRWGSRAISSSSPTSSTGRRERRAGRAGPRLGRRLARRLQPRHHRPRPAALRPALRALPESRARVDAGFRHRFLPGRPRPRHRVRESKYGAESVSQIATFGTMAAKAVVRDVGRVLDLGYNFCDQLAKLIPFQPGKHITLADAREMEPQLKEREKNEEEVARAARPRRKARRPHAQRGHARGRRADRAGQAHRFLPALRRRRLRAAVSQYDMNDVEAVGLVKFDFLGLTTLTILDWTLRYIKADGEGGGDGEPQSAHRSDCDSARRCRSVRDLRERQHDRRVPV